MFILDSADRIIAHIWWTAEPLHTPNPPIDLKRRGGSLEMELACASSSLEEILAPVFP